VRLSLRTYTEADCGRNDTGLKDMVPNCVEQYTFKEIRQGELWCARQPSQVNPVERFQDALTPDFERLLHPVHHRELHSAKQPLPCEHG
jgi:hypothetical protein